MALGSENQSQSLYQPQQQRLRQIAPLSLPYSKPIYDQQQQHQQQQQLLPQEGVSVVRRNARERNRVKQVNNGFSNLRQHIPVAVIADLSNGRRGVGPGADKKLSKVSTLRMAVEYIRRLQGLIDENDSKRAGGGSSVASQQQQQQQLHYQQQQQQSFYALQQQLQMSSPSGSTSSNCSNSSMNSSSSSDLYYAQQMQLQMQMQLPTDASAASTTYQSLKLEPSYDDYRNNSCSSGAEDDEILDYISHWQDDL